MPQHPALLIARHPTVRATTGRPVAVERALVTNQRRAPRTRSAPHDANRREQTRFSPRRSESQLRFLEAERQAEPEARTGCAEAHTARARAAHESHRNTAQTNTDRCETHMPPGRHVCENCSVRMHTLA